MSSKNNQARYIRWFDEIGIDDVAAVGGKNASLGELYRELVPQGINVPNGFAITAEAYWDLARGAGIEGKIRDALAGIDTRDSAALRHVGSTVRLAISHAELPEQLRQEILAAYRELADTVKGPLDVAVRSSATAEDLPDASFAGQQETYLNVQGDAAFLVECGIDSISLNPDAVMKTTLKILEIESQQRQKPSAAVA